MASTRAPVQVPWSSPVIDEPTLTILKWQKLKILTWEFLRELNQDQEFSSQGVKEDYDIHTSAISRPHFPVHYVLLNG